MWQLQVVQFVENALTSVSLLWCVQGNRYWTDFLSNGKARKLASEDDRTVKESESKWPVTSMESSANMASTKLTKKVG